MTKAEIIKEKNQLIEQIKTYSPLFSPFFDLDASLFDYSKSIYEFEKSELYIKRQVLLKKCLSEKLRQLYPAEPNLTDLKFDDQLACNIVDHHQVLNHPLLISSNVVANAERILNQEKTRPIIVFSSGDVPPNNYFSKNGFTFHDKKVPIFTNKEKECNSNLLPVREFDFMGNLKLAKRLSEFDAGEIAWLESEQQWIKDIDFTECRNYNDQISMIVKKQWPRLFEEKLRPDLPELLYVTQEEITTRCLLELLPEDNLVTYTLFNPDFRAKILEAFKGIVVTWDEAEAKGTHFFWRKYPGQSRSLRMYLKGNMLTPHDERFSHLAFELKKDTVKHLLKSGEIYPSLFVIFLALNFYFGVKPLVGQGSITYLNLIRNTWLKILPDSDYAAEAHNIRSYKIDKLITGLVIFFARKETSLKTLWAYDIFFNQGMSEEYFSRLFKMPFKDVLSTSLVGIYDYVGGKYVPKDKRLAPRVTSDDLAGLVFKWI